MATAAAFDVLAHFEVLGEVGLEAELVTTMLTSKVLLFQMYQLDVATGAGAAGADGVTVAAQPPTATDVLDALTGGVCRHLQQEQHTVTIVTIYVV